MGDHHGTQDLDGVHLITVDIIRLITTTAPFIHTGEVMMAIVP